MIDFVKAYCIDQYLASRLKNSICTLAEVDVSTGDIPAEFYIGKCSEFEIKVYKSGLVRFCGSLHKYHEKGFNHSDFNFEQVQQTIFSFSELIGIQPENAILENVEFGVNVSLPYPPSVLLNSIISLKCGKAFVPQYGEGFKCSLGEYRHKIYNKSDQYKLAGNLLRYELHIDKMRKIPPVKTLHDLTNAENWLLLQTMLVKHFSQIVFTDLYNEKGFGKWDSTYFRRNKDKINNSRFWQELEPIERLRHFHRLKEIQEHGQYRFSETVSELINEKVNQLKTGNVFTLQLLSENVTQFTRHYA